MYNNATFVDKEQIKNFEKIDDFLKNNMDRFPHEIGLRIRELITKILEKGHYFEAEADILNMVVDDYNQWKKENR
jgi:hypothetical protein